MNVREAAGEAEARVIHFRSALVVLTLALTGLAASGAEAQVYPTYYQVYPAYDFAIGRDPPILLMTEGCLFGWRRDPFGVCRPYPDAGFSSGNCWYAPTPYGHRRVCRWW